MGGGPVFPTQPFSTMHRSPAAMVTKPMTDPNVEIRTPRDPNTLSNYHNYVTRHTSVDFEIDFEKKRMVGTVVLKMESFVDGDAKVDVVLDSKYVQFENSGEDFKLTCL
jgi:leukotriene-A4 hydrolase